jgi:hypothetical protein
MITKSTYLKPIPLIQPVDISISFQSFTLPTGVTGLPGAANLTTETRYESHVTVSGGLNGRFSGSIYPDNMNIKGRLLNGTYDVFLGFHKPGQPKTGDLKVRTNGFRAVLVVNAGRSLRVNSLSPHKHTSDGIHIHNGYNHWHVSHPMSEGCLIIAPKDWSSFISMFLNAFPNISEWASGSSRIGRWIGKVTVRSTLYNDFAPRNDGLMA